MWSAPKAARKFSLNGEYLDQENWRFGRENFPPLQYSHGTAGAAMTVKETRASAGIPRTGPLLLENRRFIVQFLIL
jgi:hypothetical protein